MTLTTNQFAQSVQKGDLDLKTLGGSIVSCIVASGSATLVPGEAVKIVDNSTPVPSVTALTADTDGVYGFVVRNIKDQNFVAGDRVEIAIQGSCLYMEAGAAIARDGAVEVDASAKKVIPSAGINPVIGYAYDKATADQDLIRVVVTPKPLSEGVKTAVVTATLAEINAGKVLIPATAGKSIRVSNYVAHVAGNFATNTSVDLQDESANKVTVLPVADLADGAALVPASDDIGAFFGQNLTAGEALEVVNVGTAATGGTSITFTISYELV